MRFYCGPGCLWHWERMVINVPALIEHYAHGWILVMILLTVHVAFVAAGLFIRREMMRLVDEFFERFKERK